MKWSTLYPSDPQAKPEVVRETAAIAVIDGHDGFSQTAMHLALEIEIRFPGERLFRSLHRAESGGIEVREDLAARLNELAERHRMSPIEFE